MASYSRIPSPPLSTFVDLFWLYEGYQQPHKMERLLPDGSIELVVNLKEDLTRVYDPQRYHEGNHPRRHRPLPVPTPSSS